MAPEHHALLPDIELVYADDAIVVLNKPSGLLTVPGRGPDKQDCLSRRAQSHIPNALVVHRLDMATSGLLLMARGAAVQRALSQAFAAREVAKHYVAIVDGHLQPGASGKTLIDLPIATDWLQRPRRVVAVQGGQSSQTQVQVLRFDAALNQTRVALQPLTGRTHQLRVHLQAIGHAILGDTLYATPAVAVRSPRLLLHADALAFIHPLTQRFLNFESPPDF
ncbi:MAG: RNA pseudouridine synthase [Rhodoferax sp.]|nr:RNA pseudouridine synthase [Rhodoferax sp.]